jgi:beta-lactamase regulating signal transducer with metallopeptidase domain
MTLFTPWFTPTTLRLLALCLLHFLWQGAALAALAYLVMALCRRASTRYAVGVATLALMFAAPVGTFLVFRSQEQAMAPTISSGAAVTRESHNVQPTLASAKGTPSHPDSAPSYFLWLVEFWFAGVVVLSLRSAGGILLVERLRRRESIPVTEELLELCLSLQRRMGLTRAVRYCESIHLDAPAVAGWIRPVVLLPVSALAGLTAAQLEAVIAHELAHIRRFDVFINLLQVGVETLLFYHPAVWWLGKRVRAEREHCCDDAAVVLCGSPVTYAHALTRMAESKAAPQLAMAANRSPLVERIARLLGAGTSAESFRVANLSAGVLCLSAALLAGSALLGSVHHVHAQAPAPALAPAEPQPPLSPVDHAHVPEPPEAALPPSKTPRRWAVPVAVSLATPSPAPSPAPTPALAPNPSPAPLPRQEKNPAPAPAPQSAPGTPKQSYIDSINAAGLTNLSVDDIISLKVQGITADYIKSVKDLGLKVDVDTVIEFKVQGVTADYIKSMRGATGQNLDADELVSLKVQGITPEYIKEMHDLGLQTDADDIIGMKVQGVTPDYVREMRALGLKVGSDDLIGMKVQGVTPDYVKGFNELGFHPTTDELIGMKVQGVTPAYLKELQAAGFKVDVDEAIGAKVQGVTPEFIAKVRNHGFKDLTLDKLIALKETGVFDAEK